MTNGSDSHAPPAWLALAGPTAAGKSALALELARHWPVEIVSVDSALVYCGMDIGTAKPTQEERARVPHHLIDLIEPEETYSVARFLADARRLIDEIRSRGRWPLLVGGTMMYFNALRHGLDALPAADAGVRAELEADAARRGWPALHAELAAVDPVTAARLSPQDSQRIQRALEVWRLSGTALSDLQSRRANPAPSTTCAGVLLSLEPQDRAWLARRIARRLEAMLADGLVDEVRALRRRPLLRADLPAMRCVGYRQAWEALEAEERHGTSLDPKDLHERAAAATRQLAKRQLTWLRGMPERIVVPLEHSAEPAAGHLRAIVSRHLGAPGTRP